VPADYNGDGTSDQAIFRFGSGLWAIQGLPGFITGMETAVFRLPDSSEREDKNRRFLMEPPVFVIPVVSRIEIAPV